MRKFYIFVSLIMLIGVAPMPGHAEALYIKQYELFESEISLNNVPYQNPYDYKEIDLTAGITAPDGSIVIVPAFYTGQKSVWKIRYTPVQKGNFSYQFILRERSKTTRLKSGRFSVTAGTKDGFLRKNPNNPYYPIFDSGRLFFGIGHNIGWVTNNKISAYEKYFALLRDSGCNLTRIWLNSPWTFRIEGESLCNYNQGDSEKLDALLSLAQKYGIYIVLSLDSYGSLMEEKGSWDEQSWNRNPYNKRNGGPCEKPWDFFTNEDAKRYYKNRLKYVIGRWGYSPNIMAFELWNEVDAPAEWVRDISSYIKNINPHGQFVTISLGYSRGSNFDETSIWKLDEIDIIDRHLYGNTSKDIIETLINVNRRLSSDYKKFLLVGEFGMDSNKSDAAIDAAGDGIALHNSIWASTFSGSFAGALNWWWAEYVKGKNLYCHYKALRNFVRDVDWGSKEISFLETTPVMNEPGSGGVKYSDAAIKTNDAWGDTSYKEFRIDRAGNMSGGVVNSYLHGNLKMDMRIEPVFRVNYPCDGKLVLHIDMVSQGARLIVYLDGKEVLSKELPAGAGEGPWKRSLYRKDHNIYQCVYDTGLEVDIPNGEHTIKLANTGPDWVRIKTITFTNYVSQEFADARILCLRAGKDMLIWVQNKAYNSKNFKNGEAPLPVNGASFGITGLKDGQYEIEWWDTSEGKIFKREDISAGDSGLKVDLPEFNKDIACKIRSK